MRRRLYVLVLGLLIMILVACQQQFVSADWLEGTWLCKEWGINYTFEESDEHIWTISTDTETLTTQAVLEKRDDKYVLVDETGTEYHLVKKKEHRLIFQQVAAQGVDGTTTAVTFDRE